VGKPPGRSGVGRGDDAPAQLGGQLAAFARYSFLNKAVRHFDGRSTH